MSFSTSSGYAQDDTLCFGIDEAKNLLKHAEKGYICDSLITKYVEKDSLRQEIIKEKDGQLKLSENLVNALNNDLQVANKKIKWLWFGLGMSGIGIILAVIF